WTVGDPRSVASAERGDGAIGLIGDRGRRSPDERVLVLRMLTLGLRTDDEGVLRERRLPFGARPVRSITGTVNPDDDRPPVPRTAGERDPRHFAAPEIEPLERRTIEGGCWWGSCAGVWRRSAFFLWGPIRINRSGLVETGTRSNQTEETKNADESHNPPIG